LTIVNGRKSRGAPQSGAIETFLELIVEKGELWQNGSRRLNRGMGVKRMRWDFSSELIRRKPFL
jgi:hypothetical protein